MKKILTLFGIALMCYTAYADLSYQTKGGGDSATATNLAYIAAVANDTAISNAILTTTLSSSATGALWTAAASQFVDIDGDTMTGALEFETNVFGQIVFMSFLEDPAGSITTQVVDYTYTTNGVKVTGGAHDSDDLTSIFVFESANYGGSGYASYTNTIDAKLFRTHYIGASSSYYIQYGGDMCNPSAGFKKYDETITGSYTALGGLYTGTPVLTWDITTNDVILVSTNSTYTVVTNVIHSTSNQFFWVFDGTTNQFGDGDSATATNLAYIAAVAHDSVVSNAVIVDAAARDTAQFADAVDWVGAVGVPYSTTTSGSNWMTSTTIPGLSFTTDISATGAGFTAMPTSADTPDGSDPTELMNVDYLNVMLTNGFINSLTNQLHIMDVF